MTAGVIRQRSSRCDGGWWWLRTACTRRQRGKKAVTEFADARVYTRILYRVISSPFMSSNVGGRRARRLRSPQFNPDEKV